MMRALCEMQGAFSLTSYAQENIVKIVMFRNVEAGNEHKGCIKKIKQASGMARYHFGRSYFIGNRIKFTPFLRG